MAGPNREIVTWVAMARHPLAASSASIGTAHRFGPAQGLCRITPIFSSALRYSTTNSTGTGPYSADKASQIC